MGIVLSILGFCFVYSGVLGIFTIKCEDMCVLEKICVKLNCYITSMVGAIMLMYGLCLVIV